MELILHQFISSMISYTVLISDQIIISGIPVLYLAMLSVSATERTVYLLNILFCLFV